MQEPYKKPNKIKTNYEEIAKLIGENKDLIKKTDDMEERIKELYKAVNQIQDNNQETEEDLSDTEKFDVRKFYFGIKKENWIKLSKIWSENGNTSLVWDSENEVWRFYAVYAPGE